MYPTTPLQPGSTNTQAVKQLQDWLVANGYLTQAQVNTGYGTYGPQTTAAVLKAQQKLGVDNSSGPGYWGPRTISAVNGGGSPAPQTQVFTTPSGLQVDINGNTVGNAPKTQAELDASYSTAVTSHPTLAGNSADALAYAQSTGDFSGLVNAQGKPFSSADQAVAVAQATADLDPYYKAQQTKETQDTEAALASKKLAYDNYLSTQATKFQTEKTNQDQTAANNGVLFSGGRAQKLQQLGESYNTADAYKKSTVGADIGSTARDFGYKYGDSAAGGLSSYYSLGGNTYNPNVATGGVGIGGLSSVYNANQGFQGTEVNKAKAEAQKRAAGFLYNKGNKLLSSGYTNQY